jgi:hypothetical protein
MKKAPAKREPSPIRPSAAGCDDDVSYEKAEEKNGTSKLPENMAQKEMTTRQRKKPVGPTVAIVIPFSTCGH